MNHTDTTTNMDVSSCVHSCGDELGSVEGNEVWDGEGDHVLSACQDGYAVRQWLHERPDPLSQQTGATPTYW